MAEKKGSLGFKTPSMQIQEEYAEILKQITAKKTDWEKLFTTCVQRFQFFDDFVNKALKKVESKESTHDDAMELEHRVIAGAIFVAHLMVARIGKELAECDVRIAALEKELKDLRRGIK
jgi:hypothetical protein